MRMREWWRGCARLLLTFDEYFLLICSMLGHLYCAEALIMLDRVDEARHFLEPKFIAELKEDDFIHRGSPGS